MYIIERMLTSSEKRKRLQVFADYLTKYSESIRKRDQKAYTVARLCVKQIGLRHRTSQEPLTDQRPIKLHRKIAKEYMPDVAYRKVANDSISS